MNKISFIVLVFVVFSFGCETLLDVDSDRLVFPDENKLDSPNDTIYSMVGIFSQMEKLADRYVLLGELRADLMDITENADPYLQEIYNQEISHDNPYNKKVDYYSVINNCNYLINNIDTAISINAEKIMYKELAAAKAIRAWTYMQLALNYGKAKYYEIPILSIKDSIKYQEYTTQELIPMLIQDLEPWKDQYKRGGISLGIDLTSEWLYFPVQFVLGDLYLWNGEYERAAEMYYNLIKTNSYVVDEQYQSTWTVSNGVFVTREFEFQLWIDKFVLSNREQITLIAGSTEYGKGADLDSISWYYNDITPSKRAIDTWNNQTYYYTSGTTIGGDLRGDFGSYFSPKTFSEVKNDITEAVDIDMIDISMNHISKFTQMASSTSRAISIYRVAMLYLRYAEAVNRAGKPNLAFAILKNGLNSENMAIDTIVPRFEKYSTYTDSTGTFFSFVNFEDIVFDDNIGVHALGCGNIETSLDYIIPLQNSLEDSILYVENKILEELALETAFEGNRFHDLMRIALRRNDPAYLSNMVAEKYTVNKEAIRSKLMDENNWYLK